MVLGSIPKTALCRLSTDESSMRPAVAQLVEHQTEEPCSYQKRLCVLVFWQAAFGSDKHTLMEQEMFVVKERLELGR